MAKKRKPSTKPSRPRTKRHNKKTCNTREIKHKRKLLKLFYNSTTPINIKQIIKELSHSHEDKKEIEKSINAMLSLNLIQKTGKNNFIIHSSCTLFEGKFEANQRGFGFITPQNSPAREQDIFVGRSHTYTARQGDNVLALVGNSRKGRRSEAEVIDVLTRASGNIAGFFSPSANKNRVIPEDGRLNFSIDVGKNIPDHLSDGDIVLVKLGEDRPGSREIKGKIIEVLGSHRSISVQKKLVIEKHQLPHTFSPAALLEAEEFSEDINLEEDRSDLRDIAHVTIDGETAKDFDDAIFVEKKDVGFRLYVSIADVSHYVTPKSNLDEDAYQRGTSIYFPGTVIPMLPEKLSNNLCSLVPDKDRFAFTAILDFNLKGKLVHKQFTKSIIKSKKRFTYTTVQKILIEKCPDEINQHQAFITPLTHAKELAQRLQQKRIEQGTIGFTLPEPFVDLDSNEEVKTINKSERFFAHQLVEEFMLAANEAVAATFSEQKFPALYRIHESPAPEKITEFISFAHTLGLEIPKGEQDSSWFSNILDTVKDTPHQYVVNNLLLRTMQQARYSPKNCGHFGLASTDYTHFTSPIRRYPDLHVHRRLHQLIKQKVSPPSPQQDLTLIATYLSVKERIAITAEREMFDRLKVLFMEDRVGESFIATVSGITASAFFVEIEEPFINGAVALEELKDDYYIFDERKHCLVGEISMKTYSLGDTVEVTLVKADLQRHRLNFIPRDKQK